MAKTITLVAVALVGVCVGLAVVAVVLSKKKK